MFGHLVLVRTRCVNLNYADQQIKSWRKISCLITIIVT
jgi:hypothetical protein